MAASYGSQISNEFNRKGVKGDFELIGNVERIRLIGVIQDRREWVHESSSLFSVRSLFSSLIVDSLVVSCPFYSYLEHLSPHLGLGLLLVARS